MNPACNVSLVASSTATNTPLYPWKKTTKKQDPGAVILTFTGAAAWTARLSGESHVFPHSRKDGEDRIEAVFVWARVRVKISQMNETRSASGYSGNTDSFSGLLSPQFNVVAKILIIRFWNSRLTVLLKNIFASFFQSLNSGHILKLIMNVSFMPQLVGKS